VFILYSGVHYDAISMSPMESDHVDEFDQTRFDIGPTDIVDAIKELVGIRNKLHEYTDMVHTLALFIG
jgi:ubiquitin thioesterase OTU1